MLSKQTKIAMALGAATLIGTAAVTTVSANEDLGKCVGGNTCKGQSACQTADSSCAGQNSCKGKGWIKTDKKSCTGQGGQFKALK